MGSPRLKMPRVPSSLLAAGGLAALAEGGRAPPLQFLRLLGFLLTLGENLGVLGGGQSVLLGPPPLQGDLVPLLLKDAGGDQALYLGGLVLCLLTLLGGQGALDHVLAHVV